MKHARKVAALLFIYLATSASLCADSFDEFVKVTIAKRKIPGLSLAVIREGKVLRSSGYGFANVELRAPTTNDTVYEIGSISKQFASEAVMLLVQDGKLNLDDPINGYLPANAPATWAKITVRDLLHHTSGIKDWTELREFSYRREYSSEEFIDLIRSFPVQFEPKANWVYSNTNLPLIGIIVERASGRSYEDFVTDRILRPLSYSSIRFKHQGEIVINRASGYVLRNNAWMNGEPFRPKIIAASGGILANAIDLAKWWEAAVQGKIVNRTSLKEMMMPARLSDGRNVNHGFAFFINTFNGHKSVFHNGSTVGGFGSGVYHYPNENITIAVVGNLEDGGFGAEYIAKRLADLYIPGSFVGGMNGATDASLNQTSIHLQILKDLAENKRPDSLSANFAAKVGDAFRTQLGENLKRMKSFLYLGRETIGPDHFILDPAAAEFIRYRMNLDGNAVFYHFRMNKDGKIGWIIFEE